MGGTLNADGRKRIFPLPVSYGSCCLRAEAHVNLDLLFKSSDLLYAKISVFVWSCLYCTFLTYPQQTNSTNE